MNDTERAETRRLMGDSFDRLLADYFSSGANKVDEGAPAWSAVADFGLPGLEISEDFGGFGLAFDDLLPLIEILGAQCVVAPVVTSIVQAAALVSSLGSDAQQQQLLEKLARGSAKGCLAHAERGARDCLHWVETTAMRSEDGWVIDGRKDVVLNGGDADFLIVSARTSGGPMDEHGLTLFIVDAEHSGCRRLPFPLYDGSGGAEIEFTSLHVGDEAVLGPRDEAFEHINLAWDRAAAAVCAEAVGTMTAIRDLTLDYLRTREQFGQPIGNFQALQHRMADAHMAIELSRSMTASVGRSFAKGDARSRMREVSAVKVVVGRACREVGQTCIQVHGAIALTEEYRAGNYFKRLTMLERLFGSPDYHLDRYARLETL